MVCLLCAVAGSVASCTATPVQPYPALAPEQPAIYVIAGGWRTEIGLRLGEISGPLAALKPSFPGARYLVFGWGARDYYMARNPGIGDLLRAMVPGPAVMLVIPLRVPPAAFACAANAAAVPTSRDGLARLSQFLWESLAKDPRPMSAGPYPQSVFFAATGTYSLDHTCNTWTAEALHAAGLPVTASGVVFADQVLDQLPPPTAPADHIHR